MVLGNLYWRPREGFDVNDVNFVTIPEDTLKTVTDPLFVQNSWSTSEWLNTATDDDSGFFTTFLVRPGVRKLNQQKMTVTVKQTGTDFAPALISTAFFAARVGAYNDATDTFTPFLPFFSIQPINTVMMCDNLKRELKHASGIKSQLQSKLALPPPIEYAAGGFYRENILHDTSVVVSYAHTATVLKGNDVWTSHEASAPMFPSFIDSLAVPDGLAIQYKIQIYFTSTDYSLQLPPSDTSNPSLVLLDNTQIASFASPIELL